MSAILCFMFWAFCNIITKVPVCVYFFLSIFWRLTNRGKGRREKGKSSKQRAMVSELQLSLILEEPHHVSGRCDILQDKSVAGFFVLCFFKKFLLCVYVSYIAWLFLSLFFWYSCYPMQYLNSRIACKPHPSLLFPVSLALPS